VIRSQTPHTPFAHGWEWRRPFKLAMSYFDEQLLNGVMGHRMLREKGCH
jgi:hypothetical protein